MVELVTISRSSQCSTICATKTGKCYHVYRKGHILKTNKNNNLPTKIKQEAHVVLADGFLSRCLNGSLW